MKRSMILYVIVGIASLVADYGIFMFLYYVIQAGTAIAAPSGLVVGLIVNFVLNKLWSFNDRSVDRRLLIKQIVLYGILVIINSIFTYYLIETFKSQLDIEAKYTKLLATACTVLWNYFIYQRIIFNSKQSKDQDL